MKSIELHGFTLDLPDDHALPQIRRQLPDYSENVGRLAAVLERKYPGRGFIDIGANIGDTAAIVRAYSRLPILCIEGSEIYYEILKENIRRLNSDVELECALVDSATIERPGYLSVESGTATFRANGNNGTTSRFARLDSILARHPRFQTSKILKIDTDGMDGRILEGALEWIAGARPVLFWEHDIGRDVAAGGPGLSIFDRLLELGYQTALVFDNTGEFIEKVSLEARQQLADLSDYLPGGDQFYGYCDVCAFHEEDQDLCVCLREIELENRSDRRKTSQKPLNEPLFRALIQGQFELHSAQAIAAVQQTLKQSLDQMGGAPLVAELQALRAQTQLERYRMQLRIDDLETQVSSKEVEIQKLQVLVRDVVLEQTAQARSREEARHQAELAELMGQLMSARLESANLHQELDSSVALRAARSLQWILGPIRKMMSGNSGGSRP